MEVSLVECVVQAERDKRSDGGFVGRCEGCEEEERRGNENKEGRHGCVAGG